MREHTPGPWMWGIEHDDNLFSRCQILGNNSTSVLSHKAHWGVTDANRALIEAAPDMVEALQGLVFILDAAGLLNLSNGVQLGQTSWYIKASEQMDSARAAIAKAGGREP